MITAAASVLLVGEKRPAWHIGKKLAAATKHGKGSSDLSGVRNGGDGNSRSAAVWVAEGWV